MEIRSLPRDVMMGIPSNRLRSPLSAHSPVAIDVLINKPILVLIVVLAGFPFLVGFNSCSVAAETDSSAPLTGPLPEESLISVSSAGASQLNNDPLLRRWLREARSRLAAGQITAGLTFVQQILDRGDDGFVRLRTGEALVGVRSQALKLLRELSPEGRATYERLFGTQAKLLWERSRETGKVVFAAEVVRRYFHTSAGFSAANWLAARWLDHGEARAAARLWERIMAEPAHWSRITQALRLRAAVAQRLSGNESRRIELLSQIGATPLRVGGGTRSVERLVESLTLPAKGGPAASTVDWPTAAGSASRNLVSCGSVPWLKSLWSVQLFSDVSEIKWIRSWLESQDDIYPQRLSVASEPLVVREQVVIREFAGIRAFDLRTGRPLWKYPSPVSLEALIQRLAAPPSNSIDLRSVHEAFVGNSAWGTLSSDGQLVFAVDYVPIESVTDVENVSPNRNDSLAKPPPPQATPGTQGSQGAPAPGIVLRRSAVDSDAELPLVLTRLVALPLSSASGDQNKASATVRPAWTLDGRTAATKLAHSGSCLHFQGPPLALDGCLYVIGELFSLAEVDIEKNNQLCLLAIDAQTGEMLWAQGLALVDEPFFRPKQLGRRNAIGAPSAAEGMLICPTDVGLVVGVDLVTGRQRWVYDYRSWRGDSRRELFGEAHGWDGAPAWPVIHRGRVVLLPRYSDQVHCLDLTSGRLLWKAPRGDALYVGAVTDELVLLVSDREVRAMPLSMDGQTDGKPTAPAWSQRLGTVTGRGVRVGEHYLVPLKSGRIACLELATGRDCGFALRRFPEISQDVDATEGSTPDLAAAWPGNLIASGDMILSLGPSRLDAFPQAHAVLASLREQPQSVERRLLQVELAMLFGSPSSPISELQQVLREPLTPEQRREAERQLRESLYLELDRDPSQTEALLTLLDPLAKTPAERARLLRRVCEVSLPNDPLRTVNAAREFASLPMDQEWELQEDGQHTVSLDTLAHGYLRQARSRIEQMPGQADHVLDLLNTDRDRLLTATDLHALRRFVRLCDDWPQATVIRFRLADLLIERRQFQEAELLLLRDRVQVDPRVAAAATVRLLRLWDHLGLYGSAANLLVELDERFGDVPLPETELRKADLRPRRPSLVAGGDVNTGRSFVAAFPRNTLTWQAFAQRQPPTWDIHRVVISEDRKLGGQTRLIEAYDRVQRRYQTPAGMAFHLFEKEMPFGPKDVTAWQIVDKESGVVVGELADLDRVSYPPMQQNINPLALSHFLPLGGQARYRGVSLIEHDSQTSTWEHTFAPLRSSQEKILRAGPSGPNFCTFQSRQHLIVADPASGRVLWRRGNLEPQSGLFAENEWGLFGDQEALVLFAQDFSSYVVYETATGRELRRGRLNIDPQHNRKVFGRKLFYMSDVNSGRRLRIWDPLTDDHVFDEAASGIVWSNVTADGELLLVLRTGRVRVLNVHAGLVNLDVTLPAELTFGVNALPRGFSDHDRYYINLPRAMPDTGRSVSSYSLSSDSLVPKTDVQGELYAFARPVAPRPFHDANGPLGRRLWTRCLPQRSILRLEKNRLPFLIALSRLQDRQNGARTAVRVEAIAGESGNLLGVKDGVILDRFVQVQTDIAAGQLSLCGLRTQVRIDFGHDKQRLAGDAVPF